MDGSSSWFGLNQESLKQMVIIEYFPFEGFNDFHYHQSQVEYLELSTILSYPEYRSIHRKETHLRQGGESA